MADELEGMRLDDVLGSQATYYPADPGSLQACQVMAGMNEIGVNFDTIGLDNSLRQLFNVAGTDGAVVTAAQNQTPVPAPEQKFGIA